MVRKAFWPFLLLVLMGIAFWIGTRFNGNRSERNVASQGISVPPRQEEASESSEPPDSDTFPPGTVRILPAKQQLLGIRTEVAEKKPFSHIIRALARVAPDENRLYRMTAASEGWIREVFPVTVGNLVEKNQPLATCYSRELINLGQAYLSALTILDRYPDTGKGETPSQYILPRATPPRVAVSIAEDGLRSLGMGEGQIEEMKRTRQLVQYVILVSPTQGYILSRNVSPGQWFDRGAELYRIADLSRIWIFADLYEHERIRFRPGTKVKVSLPRQEKAFLAQVSDVLPPFDPATRTFKVRLEASNPDFVLRPDMFVDVELPVRIPPTLHIPVEALLDSGLKRTVFVDRGNGFFEPREVEIGWRMGGRVEILRGLKPGERIAVSGNFMIDSESKLELVAEGMVIPMAKDPVTGTEVSVTKAEKAGRKTLHQGVPYYFSSDESKRQFDRNPGAYVKP